MSKPKGYFAIPMSKFLNWLESKLIAQYSASLEGIEKRFITMFSLFRVILESIVELNLIFESTTESLSAKPLIDNIV